MKLPSFLFQATARSGEPFEERPFFLIVTLVMVVLYGGSVYASPSLRAPLRLVPFTLLMLLHLALYWLGPHLFATPRQGITYLVVQGAILFSLTLVADNLVVPMGLYPALIGLTVGVLRSPRRIAIGVIACLGLGVLSLVLTQGWSQVRGWALTMIPITFFVIVYVALYTRQAEARAHAQTLLRELETAHRQLAEYAAQVEELALAAERQRMARELHDTLAQGLAGLILQLEAASSHLASQRTERAQAIVQQAMARARVSLADARRAIGDLRQERVAPADLAAAIRTEVDRFSTATAIPCALELSLPAELTDALCEHALRMVAEGLTNTARHAQANRAWVNVTHADGWLHIQVGDDGAGFDPLTVASQAGHYGLLGMRERARLAGGTLEIDSRPGRGTVLRLRLPLTVRK
ncbi:MAG: sensor histidine kinase [Thermoflexales bacterium]|nr:sensor histidine kinase [Thermoflexales bacterium]